MIFPLVVSNLNNINQLIHYNNSLLVIELQILLLHKTWGYYNIFDSKKSMGAYYWYFKIPQCGYVEHWLKNIAFYVQKHIAHHAVWYNFALVCDKPLGVPVFMRLVYWLCCWLYRDCKCGRLFRTASEIGHSSHLVAVTCKYKKLVYFTILWRLVYAYVTIRCFIVVWLRFLVRKYSNEHRVIHDYGLCAMVKTAQVCDLNSHV